MASTYVNDLRLNEMATGDQSGSWGTVTNTNLELIAEAFSYGTEAITTNADTHTTTIADGGTDPGRSMFLKYTGTLDSACTITIGPNTVSKLWFIENATSGSQNIIIKQGSGATVTIASGKTKVIYSDGVGSAAKMVDAFDSLSVGALASAGAVSGTTGTFSGAVAGTTGTFSGAVTGASATFDGGVDIDNINIDGTTIALSSGNLTLDSAEDIVLDADGAQIKLLDGGTEFGVLQNNSSDFSIYSAVQDKDILLQGNDGGSAITALTLDMSDAGHARFNYSVSLVDNAKLNIGTGADLQIYHDGTHSYILDQGTGYLHIKTSDRFAVQSATGETMIEADANGTAKLYYDNSKKFETTSGGVTVTGNIANASGDLTLDVAGDIILDADGGDVIISDAGTEIAHLSNSSSDFKIESKVSDKDIIFRGNDGGSGITALTLDMSAAGAATFNNDVTAFSDERLKSNITTIPDALSKVTEMRGVHYVRDATGKDSTGVIAQEMQKVAPELVLTADDEMGTLSVNYGNITGYLIEAIKELKAEIEELKAR